MIGCTVPGCGGCHKARGLCLRHYRRWRRLGTTELTPRTPPHPTSHSVTTLRPGRLEDLEWLLEAGESPPAIAARLNVTLPALSRWLYRHGHRELARRFAPAWADRRTA